MRKIRDVLRLRAGGMSKRKIAASLSIGATAAGDCIRRAKRASLSWPLPEDLSDEALVLETKLSTWAAARQRMKVLLVMGSSKFTLFPARIGIPLTLSMPVGEDGYILVRPTVRMHTI